MRKLILIVFAIIYLSSSLSYSQNGWNVYYPQNSSDQLLNIQFLNLNTGYVTGQNTIFKTTNSGINWTDITSTAGRGYYAIHFLNTNTGYVGGYYNSYDSRILRTTNGGQNWIVLQTGQPDVFVRTIYAIDENIVLVGENFAGTNGKIYKSTNGGQNWVSVFNDAWKGIECIKFVNSLTGFACGSSVFKTTNAGNTWIEKTLPFQYHQYSICFLNENTGYSVGVNSIAKTINGGDNWIVQSPNVNANLFSVSFVNVNTGMVVGQSGTILRTTNGGDNWLNISRTAFYYLSGIQMLNADTVFCSGRVIDSTSRSLFAKSYTGGLTSIQNISIETPSQFSLYQNYPNPFNPTTKIRFDVPRWRGVGGWTTTLRVYDIMGREVQTLVNERLQPGTYEATFDGSALNSGVYFYKLVTDGFTETKRMILIK